MMFRLARLAIPFRPLLIAAGMLAAAAGPAFAQTPLTLVQYATGFDNPVGMVQDPVDPTVQYVVEQKGVIRVVRNGTVLTQNFLDISGASGPVRFENDERGLLGLAFAPDYADQRPRLHLLHVEAGQRRFGGPPLQAIDHRSARARYVDRLRPGVCAGPALHPAARGTHQSQGRQDRLRPRRVSLHRHGRRRLGRRSRQLRAEREHAARQDAAHRRRRRRQRHRRAIAFRPTTRSSTPIRWPRGARSGRSVSATRGASRSTPPASAAPAAC